MDKVVTYLGSRQKFQSYFNPNNNTVKFKLVTPKTISSARTINVDENTMEILGHADDETTRRIYRHVTQEMKKEASQKFAQLMRSLL